MLLVIASAAGAAGLGRLAVLSAIGEPLRAEIEVSVSPEELETAIARFAPVDAYAPAGLQYNPALNGARLAIQYRHNGRRVIDIVTTRRVNEPSIQLLVELEVRGGRIMRAYNVLLGPQGDGQARDATSVAVAPAVVPAADPVVKTAPTPALAAPGAPPASRSTVSRPAVAVPAPVAAADSVQFDREIQRLQAQLNAQTKTLAGMLDRVAVMERQVAQLQKAFAELGPVAVAPKPVTEQPAAELPPVRAPVPEPASAVAATAPMAADPPRPAVAAPPQVHEQPAATVEPRPRRPRSWTDTLFDNALLVLAGGLLVMVVGMGYWMWGRRPVNGPPPPPEAAA